MVVLGLALIVCIAVVIGVGMLAHRLAWSVGGGPARWGAIAAQRLGAVPGAIAVLVAGAVITFVIMLPVGYLAHALQHPVDDPVYRAVHSRTAGAAHTRFYEFNTHVTVLGDRSVVDTLILVSIVVLGVIYGRRWWVPTLLIVAIALLQYGGQIVLAHIIDRGYPPVAGSGTYPSGGVSRLIAVYGTVAALVVALLVPLSRSWLSRTWTGVMMFGVLEAYTRVYLSEHWLSDALAGLLFGGLLMVTAQATLAAIGAHRQSGTDRPDAREPAARVPDPEPA